MSKLTLPSRAFHSAELGRFAHKICTLLGFERVLTMNTGAEAIETAIKLARKWAYVKKGVPEDKAIVYSAAKCFHGRTIASISLSSDEFSREGFGPFTPGLGPKVELPDGTSFDIRFNHAEDLERAFELHGKNVAAFVVEPVQGEAGIIVPSENYLRQVQDLCRRYNVLFICDEIQAGLGRTGKLLAHQHWGVKPDMVTLAKALSGGTYPISAVLSSSEVMVCSIRQHLSVRKSTDILDQDCIKPGQHGSTYGGNPLACAVACTSLDVLIDEDLAARSLNLGEHFRTRLNALKHIDMDPSTSSPGLVTAVRGLGLMNAIDINPDISAKGRGAWHLCLLMASKGVLAKPTHRHTIRLAPPLVITREDLDRAVDVIEECLRELDIVEVIEDLSVHAGSETFVSL